MSARGHYSDLSGKAVVVTGAAGGIGLEAVRNFASAGSNVFGLDRDRDRLTAALAPLGGGVHPIVLDLTDVGAVRETAGAVAARAGQLDVWINNAGYLSRTPAIDLEPAEWDTTMAVNLRATFFAAQAAAKIMVRGGGGAIVNLSSYAALKARPNCADYAAAKAGVAHLTRCLALEWGGFGIRVNAVAPGYIETPMTAWLHQDAEMRRRFEKKTPLGRLGAPSDVAEALLFLASDASRYMTGEILVMDGGLIHN